MSMIDVLRAKAEIAAAQLKLKQAELAVLLGAGKEPEPEPEPAPCAWLGQARYGTERQAERARERTAQLAEDHRDWQRGGKGTGMPETVQQRPKQFTEDHRAWIGGGPGGKIPQEGQQLMYTNPGGNSPRWFGPEDL